MTAALISNRRSSNRGLRPYDGRKDLGALADLIEMSFSDHLDQAGAQMIRGMRFFSRAGWLGWVLSRWLLPPAANPLGFIWEENGHLVGNASLMPVNGCSWRWVMANVAVEPGMRRRGIASEMVSAAIEASRRSGAQQIILQDDSDNAGAQALYRKFGFKVLSSRTTWVRPGGMDLYPPLPIRVAEPCKGSDWREQYDLARRLHPEGLIWPYPTTSGIFRRSLPGYLLGNTVDGHWVVREHGKISGSLSLRRGADGRSLRTILLVDPPSNERAVTALLGSVFQEGASGTRRYLLEYPIGESTSALSAFGFIAHRDLVWMGLDLSPGNMGRVVRS
jgi:ribosomal protein S18 acetylase RimI-like enzyme